MIRQLVLRHKKTIPNLEHLMSWNKRRIVLGDQMYMVEEDKEVGFGNHTWKQLV